MRIIKILTIAFICFFPNSQGFSKIIIYPAPKGEPVSSDFSVMLNGMPVFVYQARVSAIPVNQVWPGYQRPPEQTEIASFCYFDTDEEVEIEIKSSRPVNNVIIRPLYYGIKPSIEGNTIKFKIKKLSQLVVEINDWHKSLHIFANPVESKIIDTSGVNVLYFGPGYHNAGIITAKDNQTIFISGGAVVNGSISAKNIKNLNITGRGILDASMYERGKGGYVISVSNCENVSIDGVIIRDPSVWTVVFEESQHLIADNIKLIGLWRYNSDGIDIVNSSHVKIRNSFIRAYDDNIVLKGSSQHGSDLFNIRIDNCILFNDWGYAIKFGTETFADQIYDAIFRNCDIIHYVHGALGMQISNRAHVYDILFDDIRVEEPIVQNVFLDNKENPLRDINNITRKPDNPESLGRLISLRIYKKPNLMDTVRGKIDHVTFRNIRYSGNHNPQSNFAGFDADHEVADIVFDKLYIRDKLILDEKSGNFIVGKFVRNLQFK